MTTASPTTPPPPPNGIVLFHYAASPYARRVRWYLALRRIDYAECIQPPVMPRPDLAALDVRYRRTPTMAIGRDVYVDTRMIIQRLEEFFPVSKEHPGLATRESAGVAALLNKLTVDAGLFGHAVGVMPSGLPMLKDKVFMKDRGEFAGGAPWSVDAMERKRPEALVHLRQCFEILEAMFNDGREWVAGTDKLTLADLEGLWAIDWAVGDLQAPKEYFSEQAYPRVYAWRARFKGVLQAATSSAPKATRIKGADAVQAILGADFSDKNADVDARDPVKIPEGTEVQLFPTDGGGSKHKDAGRLVKLTKDEVAIASISEKGEKEVRIHAPRWNFRIQPTGGSSKL